MTFEQAVEHNLSKDEEALPTAQALEAGVAPPSRGVLVGRQDSSSPGR
jgi:hypothetical protein